MLRVTANSYADAKACPLRDVLDMLGDKWTFIVLAVLEDGPMRFSQIKKLIGDISQRVLTSKLRDLERDGYVARNVFPTSPPRVAYSLTQLGRSALGPITQLMTWSIESHESIRAARAKFDRLTEQRKESGGESVTTEHSETPVGTGAQIAAIQAPLAAQELP
jgi:DNA-binding HxlR family transcriptional regulator